MVAKCPLLVVCLLLVGSAPLHAEDAPVADPRVIVSHQVTGLFMPDRVTDLNKVVATIPNLELVDVDFDTAVARFRYDPAKAFNNANPQQTVEQLHNMLGSASRWTFGAKPVCTVPREELEKVEIAVVGLDCKACSLGLYEVVYRVEGVEQVIASFKTGLVTAWVHPGKANQKSLEELLKQRGVVLKSDQLP